MASKPRTNEWFISGSNGGMKYYWSREGMWVSEIADRSIYSATEAQQIFHELEYRDRYADSEDHMCPLIEPFEGN